MSEWISPPIALGLALLAGLVLGAAFYGGLWYTTSRGAIAKSPAIWFFVSSLLRMGIALAGFYWVGGGHWQRMLLCLLGFLVARLAVTHCTRSPAAKPRSTLEASHAP